MYLLNLLFNLDVVNGRFSGPAVPPGPLNTSVNWLKLNEAEPADPNTPAFDPETADWLDIGQGGTVLIPGRIPPAPENISVRLAPHSDCPPLAPNATAVIVVSFGRSVRATQERSSPFVETGAARTTFIFGPQVRNTDGGWYFCLGDIDIRPTNPNLTHRYEFSIGVIVTSGARVRHFGEDPEMDIGL